MTHHPAIALVGRYALLLPLLAACGATDEASVNQGLVQGCNGIPGICSLEASCDEQTGACVCNAFWTGDGFVCSDIDECAEDHPCGPGQQCINRPGAPAECVCPSGQFLNPAGACVDAALCGQLGCDRNAACAIDSAGEPICECLDGFVGDGFNCAYADACADDPCDASATCFNVIGGFLCQCRDGFATDPGGRCLDVNECAIDGVQCGPHQHCENTPGAFACQCDEGFEADQIGSGICVDIDECADRSLCDGGTCHNQLGAYACVCGPGYVPNATQTACLDVDECLNLDCGPGGTCENLSGTFECRCSGGYNFDGTTCTDVNECLSDNTCAVNALCENTTGSYQCTCPDGYSGDGSECTDIDECAAAPCGPNAACTNVAGAHACVCGSGYAGDGVVCVDINECAMNPSVCGDNAECVNTDGAYACDCAPGFHAIDGWCADINECIFGTASCDAAASCQNTIGSYGCTCLPGYTGDGATCDDVDECLNGPCASNEVCLNTGGSFVCECAEGYEPSGAACSDVDECRSDPCGAHAVCANLPGTYSCQCAAGFEEHDGVCEDIDECDNPAACPNGHDCSNLPGEYSCGIGEGCVGSERELFDTRSDPDATIARLSIGEQISCTFDVKEVSNLRRLRLQHVFFREKGGSGTAVPGVIEIELRYQPAGLNARTAFSQRIAVAAGGDPNLTVPMLPEPWAFSRETRVTMTITGVSSHGDLIAALVEPREHSSQRNNALRCTVPGYEGAVRAKVSVLRNNCLN